MSFRNIRSGIPSGKRTYAICKPSVFEVLRTRIARKGDEGMWQDIYKKQVGKSFIVDDWVVWLVGIAVGVGAGIGGFYLGKKLCTVRTIKELIPSSLRGLEPQQLKQYLKSKIS